MAKFPLHLKFRLVDPNTGEQASNEMTVALEHTDGWQMLMHLLHAAKALEEENDRRHWSANGYPIPGQH